MNGMELNASKCATISFSRTHRVWNYILHLALVSRVQIWFVIWVSSRKHWTSISIFPVLIATQLQFYLLAAHFICSFLHLQLELCMWPMFVLFWYSQVLSGHISTIEASSSNGGYEDEAGFGYQSVDIKRMSNFLQLTSLNAYRSFMNLVFLDSQWFHQLSWHSWPNISPHTSHYPQSSVVCQTPLFYELSLPQSFLDFLHSLHYRSSGGMSWQSLAGISK